MLKKTNTRGRLAAARIVCLLFAGLHFSGGTVARRLFALSTANCAWAEDGSTVYIAANTAIYRVRLTTKGAGF